MSFLPSLSSGQNLSFLGNVETRGGQLGPTVFATPSSSLVQNIDFADIYATYVLEVNTPGLFFTLEQIGPGSGAIAVGYSVAVYNEGSANLEVRENSGTVLLSLPPLHVAVWVARAAGPPDVWFLMSVSPFTGPFSNFSRFVNNTLFVDAQFGSANGVREDPARPFLTVPQAYAAAQPEDCIVVYSSGSGGLLNLDKKIYLWSSLAASTLNNVDVVAQDGADNYLACCGHGLIDIRSFVVEETLSNTTQNRFYFEGSRVRFNPSNSHSFAQLLPAVSTNQADWSLVVFSAGRTNSSIVASLPVNNFNKGTGHLICASELYAPLTVSSPFSTSAFVALEALDLRSSSFGIGSSVYQLADSSQLSLRLRESAQIARITLLDSASLHLRHLGNLNINTYQVAADGYAVFQVSQQISFTTLQGAASFAGLPQTSHHIFRAQEINGGTFPFQGRFQVSLSIQAPNLNFPSNSIVDCLTGVLSNLSVTFGDNSLDPIVASFRANHLFSGSYFLTAFAPNLSQIAVVVPSGALFLQPASYLVYHCDLNQQFTYNGLSIADPPALLFSPNLSLSENFRGTAVGDTRCTARANNFSSRYVCWGSTSQIVDVDGNQDVMCYTRTADALNVLPGTTASVRCYLDISAATGVSTNPSNFVLHPDNVYTVSSQELRSLAGGVLDFNSSGQPLLIYQADKYSPTLSLNGPDTNAFVYLSFNQALFSSSGFQIVAGTVGGALANCELYYRGFSTNFSFTFYLPRAFVSVAAPEGINSFVCQRGDCWIETSNCNGLFIEDRTGEVPPVSKNIYLQGKSTGTLSVDDDLSLTRLYTRGVIANTLANSSVSNLNVQEESYLTLRTALSGPVTEFINTASVNGALVL